MALENWLNRNVETEQYRSRVRCVALGLGDLKACSEEMLSHALNLDDWPLLARHRFLDAWRVLKAEGAAPAPPEAAPALPPVVEAASPPAPAPEEEEEEAEAPPPAATKFQRPPKFREDDRVKARWLGKQGGWYEGTVVGVRANDDGKPVYSVAFDDDDQDDNVIERHIKALPAPAPAAEDDDDDATAPYNEGPQLRRRTRAAETPAAKPKAGARGTAAKHPKPPPGGLRRKGAKWDAATGRVGRRVQADQARRAGRRGARAEEAEGVAGAPRLRGRRARRGALGGEVVARGRPRPRGRRVVRGALGRLWPVRLRRGRRRARGALERLGQPRTHLRQVRSRRPGIGRRHRAVSLVSYTGIGTR